MDDRARKIEIKNFDGPASPVLIQIIDLQ